MKGGSGPAPFLMKTHEMVEAANTDHVISWGETGSSFVVWRPTEFAGELLPANFKHCNFSSFVRQLNTYGFRKVVPDRWEFANENFRRAQPELLSEIKRRKAPSLQGIGTRKLVAGIGGQISSMSNSGEGNSSSSTSTTKSNQQQLLELSCENEKLKEDNKLLSSELALTKKQCQELLTSLSKYVDVGHLNKSVLMHDAMVVEEESNAAADDDDNKEECLKIFGVVMNKCGVSNNKKRKLNGCEVSWVAVTNPTGSHKVCN